MSKAVPFKRGERSDSVRGKLQLAVNGKRFDRSGRRTGYKNCPNSIEAQSLGGGAGEGPPQKAALRRAAAWKGENEEKRKPVRVSPWLGRDEARAEAGVPVPPGGAGLG